MDNIRKKLTRKLSLHDKNRECVSSCLMMPADLSLQPSSMITRRPMMRLPATCTATSKRQRQETMIRAGQVAS